MASGPKSDGVVAVTSISCKANTHANVSADLRLEDEHDGGEPQQNLACRLHQVPLGEG